MSIHLSKKIYEVHDQDDLDFGRVLMHWCPGCKSRHVINITKPNAYGAIWSWNEDPERPTFSPSINIVGRCHYFIRDGRIEFCSDSKHELAGQTVELPDFPEWSRA